MSEMLTDVRFWQQVMTDAKRTVFCSPENESRCKGYIAARGLEWLIAVKATPAVPDDRLFVVDEEAIKATTAEILSKPIRLRA